MASYGRCAPETEALDLGVGAGIPRELGGARFARPFLFFTPPKAALVVVCHLMVLMLVKLELLCCWV